MTACRSALSSRIAIFMATGAPRTSGHHRLGCGWFGRLRPEGPFPSAQVEDLGYQAPRTPALKGPFGRERPLQGRALFVSCSQVFDLG